jgi:hypothetical protein
MIKKLVLLAAVLMLTGCVNEVTDYCSQPPGMRKHDGDLLILHQSNTQYVSEYNIECIENDGWKLEHVVQSYRDTPGQYIFRRVKNENN